MSLIDVVEKNVSVDTQRPSSSYVPPLQRTKGQPAPIAANGGLSYMSFDHDGDAGTAKALQDALAEIASGENQRVEREGRPFVVLRDDQPGAVPLGGS